jgi:energy-coupling factor transporter ATP-binding protein EcfA2
VLLATHDRDTIERVGRRVITLEQGRLVSDVELLGKNPPRLHLPPESPEPPEETARPVRTGPDDLPTEDLAPHLRAMSALPPPPPPPSPPSPDDPGEVPE